MSFVDHFEAGADVFMIGNAARVKAFYDVVDLVRYFHFRLIGHLEVPDHDEGCRGGYQGYFIDFIGGEKGIAHLYDSLFTVFLAFEVVAEDIEIIIRHVSVG